MKKCWLKLTDKDYKVLILSFVVTTIFLFIIWGTLVAIYALNNFLWGYLISIFFSAVMFVARFKSKGFVLALNNPSHSAVVMSLLFFLLNLLLLAGSVILAVMVDKYWVTTSITWSNLISNIASSFFYYCIFIVTITYLGYRK